MIVLVHGLGVGQRYFDRLADELDGELLRPTLGQPATIPALAAELESLLSRPAVLVAQSMGCQVATELAVRRPDLVARLVLIGPTVDPRFRSFGRQALRLALDGWYEPPWITRIALLDYLRHGSLAQARYALADRIEQRLPRLELPALVVRGARDPLCPPEWGRRAAELLPQGRLVTIAGAAHAAHASHPREVAALVTGG